MLLLRSSPPTHIRHQEPSPQGERLEQRTGSNRFRPLQTGSAELFVSLLAALALLLRSSHPTHVTHQEPPQGGGIRPVQSGLDWFTAG